MRYPECQWSSDIQTEMHCKVFEEYSAALTIAKLHKIKPIHTSEASDHWKVGGQYYN